MKLSLRNKYLAWLVLLIGLIVVAVMGVLLMYSYHEVRTHGLDPGEELEEILAVLGTMALSFPLLLWAAWWISGRLLEPLGRVLKTAEDIEKGDLNRRIPPLAGDDELAALAEAINRAFERYAVTVRRLENFSADASHQLRTPLSAIRTCAEVALQRERTAEQYQEALGDVLNQAITLQQCIDQLLTLAKLDRSLIDRFAPLDVVDLARARTDELMAAAGDMGMGIAFSTSIDRGMILGDPVLLREALGNILDNALQAAGPDGKIFVEVQDDGAGGIRLVVADSGRGFSEADGERLFDRFYRGRSAGYAGSGLGLAIVREILALHGATIKAEPAGPLGGAVFVARFRAVGTR